MNYIGNFPRLVFDTRIEHGESQNTFAKRFGKSHDMVSFWENGRMDAPYEVLYFCLKYMENKKDDEVGLMSEDDFDYTGGLGGGYVLKEGGRDKLIGVINRMAEMDTV